MQGQGGAQGKKFDWTQGGKATTTEKVPEEWNYEDAYQTMKMAGKGDPFNVRRRLYEAEQAADDDDDDEYYGDEDYAYALYDDMAATGMLGTDGYDFNTECMFLCTYTSSHLTPMPLSVSTARTPTLTWTATQMTSWTMRCTTRMTTICTFSRSTSWSWTMTPIGRRPTS